MPEGDTIHRAAATLHRALAGRAITRFDSVYAHLAATNTDKPVAGRTMLSVEAVGKHLLMHMSGDLILRTHMRMHGSWHIYRPGERWRAPRAAMRILLATDAWIAVAFNVPVADLITTADLPRHRPIAGLGPDLLGDAFPADEAVRRLQRHPYTAIAPALLDQTIVAGIGNVYKSETLFLAGVHPDTLLAALDSEALAAILGHARRLLQVNAASGQPRRTTGRLHPGERLWVYGRGGRPCRRCGTPIDRRVIAGRSTYWCPACQIR